MIKKMKLYRLKTEKQTLYCEAHSRSEVVREAIKQGGGQVDLEMTAKEWRIYKKLFGEGNVVYFHR